jgi:hypothetical protein
MQKDVTMFDVYTQPSAMRQDWTGWPTHLGQAVVALLAKTRQEWALREWPTAAAAGRYVDDADADEFDHPSFGGAAGVAGRRPALRRVRLRSAS